jgi:drug/metabolite transporter (DMT)-like permease
MTLPQSGRKDNVSRAIVLTLITIVVFTVQDAVAKVLVQDYSSFQITMMRYWGFALFALYLVSRQGPLRRALSSKVPKWQVLRGALLMGDIWLFAAALKTVPLGELAAINLIYPLMVTVFAIPILGEKVGIFRFAAVTVGFLGALIIVRPGGLPLDVGVLFAAGSATLYSIYIVITRKVSEKDSAATSLAYTAVVGLVLSSVVGVFFWVPMDINALLMVLVLTVTTCAGHGLMVLALGLAPASVIQPFNYFALPTAIVVSALFFGHLIDPISMVGAGIIVAAGLVVSARERVKRVRPAVDPSLPGHE